MNETIIAIITFLISAAIFIPVGILIRKKLAESKIKSAENEANRILANAKKEAENARKEEILKAKEEALQTKNELDREIKERRGEVQQQEKRLFQREEALERRSDNFERREKELEKNIQEVDKKKKSLDEVYNKQITELQRIAGLSREEAKKILLQQLDRTLNDEKAALIKSVETNAKETANKKAREIIGYAIQKCAADHTSETTVSVVALPNDDMK